MDTIFLPWKPNHMFNNLNCTTYLNVELWEQKIDGLVGNELNEYRVYPKSKVNERGEIAPTSP